jgi:RimJ/RimL family protein N-acetyltransferase
VKIRTMVEADLDTVLALIAEQQSVNTATVERYHDYVAQGYFRNDRTWIAEEDGKVLALAIWWGMPDAAPYNIEGLYYTGDGDPVPVWAAMIQHTLDIHPADAEPIEYHFFLSHDWQDDPEVFAGLEPRVRAAAAVGLTEVTDRLRFEWKPEFGLPPRPTRLRFEPADDEAFVSVFMQVSQGSLDAATARSIARLGVEGEAREALELYKSMPGDRGLWRLAYDEDGKLIGFAMPSANAGGPVVGYLGVLPEHRGQRYIDELLAEITHVLADQGAERITADTDLGNVPMAKSFERAGYRNFAVRRVLSFPTGQAAG